MRLLFVSFFFWMVKRRSRFHQSTRRLRSRQDEELYYSRSNPGPTSSHRRGVKCSAPTSRTAREGWPLPRRRFGILDSFVSWASAWPSRTAESPCAQTLAVLCRLILPCAHQDSVCLHMLIPLQSPLGKSPLSAPGTEVLHLRRRDRSTFNKAKRTRPCLWRQSALLQPSPGHCWWLILQGPWEVFAPASSCV